MTTPIKLPIVHFEDGRVFADSREVAEFFEKKHHHVLRDVDAIIRQQPDLTPTQFWIGVYTLENTGSQEHRRYLMTEEGFTLLAMGFKGEKALHFKLRYIDAFKAMEKKIRGEQLPDFTDPVKAARAWADQVEQVQIQGLQIEDMREDVETLERLSKADGSLNITETAKALGMRPRDLSRWLSSNRWIYKRAGSKHWLGYQDRCNKGLLEHKTTTVQRADGSDKITEQVRITPAGLTKLSKLFNYQSSLSLQVEQKRENDKKGS